MNIYLNNKNQYKMLVSILPEYANTVLFVAPDYVDFREEPFYKTFSKQLMSSTNITICHFRMASIIDLKIIL